VYKAVGLIESDTEDVTTDEVETVDIPVDETKESKTTNKEK